MALKTFVKISNINNLSDARYCAGMYVDLMGFNLENNHKDFVAPEKYKEITDWISGVAFVAEFETSHPDSILELVKSYPNLTSIEVKEEFHIKMLVNSGYGIIWKVDVKTLDDFDDLIAKAESYKNFDVVLHLSSDTLELDDAIISKIKSLASSCNVLLGFGIETKNITNIIDETNIKGICLKGGDEIKPGIRDFDELADILESLEIED
ncbi:phosphoribosylanthranilate isomerase [Belliella kenyensis]|uniref:phosphoribosylanthranilate isomerase n=1 Tax=Belliella kenyensis TaxID=1472724 RepID=A0ABV8EK90_9BACT|nr:phosphoribosylanthranilate isomerase [Belliella kenyensis]MCH7403233.1 phosphoribosylanthranilate isomerase [Belliella kenyensis]MDN3604844.1 phosphoribosylanthranilate isomerase [Belliella kenyensis]